MGLFRPTPNLDMLAETTKALGIFYTLPVPEIRRLRKDWIKAWRATKISAPEFVVARYGFEILADRTGAIPTRGVALRSPQDWPPNAPYGPEHAVAVVQAVLDGRIDDRGMFIAD